MKTQNEKFSALLYVKSINGYAPEVAAKRCSFEDMTPIFPEERISLELSRSSVAMRIMDLISPVGKGAERNDCLPSEGRVKPPC